jgi:(E)-4-hydroxy-3-methylbut-2-enyl-diphosphate synthase
MVYLAGKADHKMDNAHMLDHIVELMEVKAAEIEAELAAAEPAFTEAAE